jgi:DNA-binding NtrC family response regulator
MIQCLLVAGDKPARDTIKVGLDQTGSFEVDTADDVWAVEMAKAKAYQVVIADTALADGTDGLELLRRIRAVLPTAELLMIARNKGQSRYLTQDKQQLGIYAFLQFPVEKLEFFKTLARLLERVGTDGAPATPAAA